MWFLLTYWVVICRQTLVLKTRELWILFPIIDGFSLRLGEGVTDLLRQISGKSFMILAEWCISIAILCIVWLGFSSHSSVLWKTDKQEVWKKKKKRQSRAINATVIGSGLCQRCTGGVWVSTSSMIYPGLSAPPCESKRHHSSCFLRPYHPPGWHQRSQTSSRTTI